MREVAAQLAIAIAQANLLARVKDHAAELESRVRARTAELDMLHSTTLEISKAADSTEAFTLLLRKVCEYSGWCFAQTWLPHAGTSRLKLGAAWYSQDPRLDAFRQENERLAFAPVGSALERAGRSREPCPRVRRNRPRRSSSGCAA